MMKCGAYCATMAFAMGMAAGFERMAFHSLIDRSTDDEVWGLLRNDGVCHGHGGGL